jgi:hypothetical protein
MFKQLALIAATASVVAAGMTTLEQSANAASHRARLLERDAKTDINAYPRDTLADATEWRESRHPDRRSASRSDGEGWPGQRGAYPGYEE